MCPYLSTTDWIRLDDDDDDWRTKMNTLKSLCGRMCLTTHITVEVRIYTYSLHLFYSSSGA